MHGYRWASRSSKPRSSLRFATLGPVQIRCVEAVSSAHHVLQGLATCIGFAFGLREPSIPRRNWRLNSLTQQYQLPIKRRNYSIVRFWRSESAARFFTAFDELRQDFRDRRRRHLCLCGAHHPETAKLGGDQSANQALWRIVMVRLVADPRTRGYVAPDRRGPLETRIHPCAQAARRARTLPLPPTRPTTRLTNDRRIRAQQKRVFGCTVVRSRRR